ncbi:MAG TPA: peptidoglycan DD-metalloendopeptidase family protein [Acidimicrobiales bacterium]|nr:peptidoglycan DD-metalloendopeptidase family protein [Acidimicrobiales bacterium]
MRRVAVVLAAIAVLSRPVPAAADPAAGVTYRPPVDAPLVDSFRPPPQPWAPGNRGVDYATTPGTPVAAAAPGEVVYAGRVGGALHVVVLHEDGIRTSYSFLDAVTVRRGDRVAGGQEVGRAGDRLHFGARVGDTYIDPLGLFAGGPPEVHLVPDEERRPASEARERAGLLRSLAGVASTLGRLGKGALAWARDEVGEVAARPLEAAWDEVVDTYAEVVALFNYAWDVNPAVGLARVARAGADWWAQRKRCTPAEVVAPRLGQRHIAVTVGGLDSTGAPGGSPVDDLDTASLGYAGADVVRFSYSGEQGQTTAESPYSGRDTSQDIRESARRLRRLLERLEREHPGVPIDIIAHSHGGVVARQALATETDPGDPTLPPINALVTLGTPHTGSELTSGVTLVGRTGVGELAETAVDGVRSDNAALRGVAVEQLSESSSFVDRLKRTPLPPGVRVTSIGAQGDLVAPARHTRLEGADNIVLTSPGGVFGQHSALPGSPEARREVALALAGMAPTCQTLGDMLVDAAVTETITASEDALALAVWFGATYVDRRITDALPGKPTKKETARP